MNVMKKRILDMYKSELLKLESEAKNLSLAPKSISINIDYVEITKNIKSEKFRLATEEDIRIRLVLVFKINKQFVSSSQSEGFIQKYAYEFAFIEKDKLGRKSMRNMINKILKDQFIELEITKHIKAMS